MSTRRSSNERLKTSSRQPDASSARRRASSSCAAEIASASSVTSLPPIRTVPKRNRWPVRRALSRRARSVRPAKRCAPAASPVPAQTAEMSFRWLHTRSSSRRIVRARPSSAGASRPSASSTACAYATPFVTAHAAQALRDVAGTVLEARALGGALEAAVLVEESRVEVEDLLADEVEAEVPRLDDPGVNRSDRDLVGVSALHRHRPARDVEVVLDEWSKRLVTVEAHAVEVVRLSLVPARRGDDVDDRRHGTCHGRRPSRCAARRSRSRARLARARHSRRRRGPANDHPPSSASRIRSRYPVMPRPTSPRRAPSPAATERGR